MKANGRLLITVLVLATMMGSYTEVKRGGIPLNATYVNIKLLDTNETVNSTTETKEENSSASNQTTSDNPTSNTNETQPPAGDKAAADTQTPDKPVDNTPPPAEVNPPKPQPSTPSPQPVVANVSYKRGSRGAEIKEIQKKLNSFGYKLAADGIFGRLTENAVISFQKKNKLAANGIVDVATMQKLGIELKAETPVQSSPEVDLKTKEEIEQYINKLDFPSSTKYFIWIDAKKQKVNIFNGSNHNWKLEKSMLCSSGKATTPTIKGNFAVGIKGSYFIADGGARCKYYTQINGNYLFHSVLYNNSGTRIVDGTLGVPVSHGCVRLAVENAKYIYDNIPKGTAIWSD